MDVKQAVHRLQQGEISGLAVLVEHYQTPAIRTAYLITHDLALAEDVVQDVFLQVYRYINSFDPDRPFKPWFMRSVVNAAVKAAKAQGRHVSLEESPIGSHDDDTLTLADIFPDPAPSPDDHIELAEVEDAVEEALRQLSPDQRAAIVLRYYLNLSDDEMAERMQVAPGTVRWRLHAARKQLGVLLRRLGPSKSAFHEPIGGSSHE